MILYHGGGAQDFDLNGPALPDDYWDRIRANVCRLLERRGHAHALHFFSTIPFSLSDATNGFNDQFTVLHAMVPIDLYEQLGAAKADGTAAGDFKDIVDAIGEVGGHFVRFVDIALELEQGASPVPAPTPRITSDVVERALADAEQLLRSPGGARSAVDRVHTALHGYLRAACDDQQIPYVVDEGVTSLFRSLREHHPAVKPIGARANDIRRILAAISTILDALNPVRNRATMAHPNEDLLEPAEAMLVINAVRTLLHYLDAKLHR